MPSLPVLQGHWRLLEHGELIHEGDEIYRTTKEEWEPFNGVGMRYSDESMLPIRRRVAPIPKCETCPSWVHTVTSDGSCSGMYCKQGLGKGVTSLPQDGSGWCCLHPQSQEVTR